MPLRHIQVPSPVTIVDPTTKQPTQEAISFAFIVGRLMENPKWAESYAGMRAQRAILDALGAANGVMTLAEEDWVMLRDAALQPKVVVQTPQGGSIASGIGVNPAVASQLLPLLQPIVDASQDAPA